MAGFLKSLLRDMTRALTRSLEVIEHTENQLVIWSDRGPMTFNGNYKTISRSGRVIARFEPIRQVELRPFKDDYGHARAWAVRLRINWWRSLHVGRTHDDATASICAAHIGTITGKPVVVLR